MFWTVPVANASPITAYRIEIRKKDGSYTEEKTNCDGKSFAIITQTKCRVPHTVLIAAPFNLVQGDAVIVRVYAINAYGDSEVSYDGRGAVIIVVPSAPANLKMLETTTVSKIVFSWDRGFTNGGSAIIDYTVSYDQASSTYVVLAANHLTQTYSTTVTLVEGALYKFKV